MSLPPPRASAQNYNEPQFALASLAWEAHLFGRVTPGSGTSPCLVKYFREKFHLAYPLRAFTGSFLPNHKIQPQTKSKEVHPLVTDLNSVLTHQTRTSIKLQVHGYLL